MNTFNPYKDKGKTTQYFKYKVVKSEPIENIEKYKIHRRLRVFYEKGFNCANPQCDNKGTQLIHCVDRLGNKHLDVYDDKLLPFNIDHTIPKSKGGSNNINNLEPMCYICNNSKGNIYDENELVYKDIKNMKRVMTFKDYSGNIYDARFTKGNAKMGDTVYKSNNKKKTSYRLLGEIIEIIPNLRHPNAALSARIKGQDITSLYTIKSLYTKDKD